MKANVKIIIKIFLLPLLVFFNPVTFKVFGKINEYVSSIVFAMFIRGNPFKITTLGVPAVKGGRYISVFGKLHVGKRCRFECFDKYGKYSYEPSLKIGDNVVFGDDCHVGCINEIEIGNGVLIGSKVLITDHAHGNSIDERLPRERELFSKGAVIIGDNCWIGENVAILPNVKIGKNCIIGANSVVTKSFGDNTVIAGNPAVEIKKQLMEKTK